jgi:hypothetical protein
MTYQFRRAVKPPLGKIIEDEQELLAALAREGDPQRFWRAHDESVLPRDGDGVAVDVVWANEIPDPLYCGTSFRWRFRSSQTLAQALDYHLREFCVRHPDYHYDAAMVYRLGLRWPWPALDSAPPPTCEARLGDLVLYHRLIWHAGAYDDHFRVPRLDLEVWYPDSEVSG